MTTVIVASQNPVKLKAVRAGFTRMFPEGAFAFQTVSVPSGVSVQPFSSAETLLGASNRAAAARNAAPEADFWVGVEGGVEYASEKVAGLDGASASDLDTYAWVVVLSRDKAGKGRTGVFFLPAKVAALVEQGMELGEADDRVFGRTNSKQVNGAVGLLTGDLIDRAAFYEQAVVLALIPFKNPELY